MFRVSPQMKNMIVNGNPILLGNVIFNNNLVVLPKQAFYETHFLPRWGFLLFEKRIENMRRDVLPASAICGCAVQLAVGGNQVDDRPVSRNTKRAKGVTSAAQIRCFAEPKLFKMPPVGFHSRQPAVFLCGLQVNSTGQINSVRQNAGNESHR